ncbi:hypothetical protein SNE25_04035 [Mucilaginibacter sabulilitoris]|uniref:SIR2-like domain-containing protein n=1 Tax=Mucilaginibacter sabulilitoris TaxID=1173583 RepID=A0ABZ0TR97_9SPHI|nr:SIR2 family protein [Mucilaginibacter sabulilitoris]WPU94688.1 hypothetical protein SNE25_04035 [Mucilaginibacter sabulilitoris]
MMKRPLALLIGNGINDSTPGKGWGDVLDDIAAHCGLPALNKKGKPFPVIYDEIFLRALKTRDWDELEVKRFIATAVNEISSNELHARVRAMNAEHVMTTNYDYAIQGIRPQKNEGLVFETTYSIFRKHQFGETTYWHIHGECNYPASINLGYEHYCGQLQHMRNYTVNGTQYQSKEVPKKSLVGRLRSNQEPGFHSWIDLFFTHDVHIIGLTLDFVETDLWWLLTYRARLKYYKSKRKGTNSIKVDNQIHYYLPEKYEKEAESKLQVMEANDVVIHRIPGPDKTPYYQEVFDRISK